MSKKLAVLGLDGLDYTVVNNHEEFAWFGAENYEERMGLLMIDTYCHTAPSWTLAFTGLDVANELGIKGFKGVEDGEPHWYTTEDIPKPFIWDILEAHGYRVRRSNWLGFDHKFTGDFKYDCEYIDDELDVEHDMNNEDWNRTMFDVKPPEIERYMQKQWGEMKEITMDEEPNTIISYFHGPDLAGHIFRNAGKDWDTLIENYHNVENLTREMAEWYKGQGYDVLYLSDHGLPDGTTRWKGEQVCTHKATGIIGGTLDLDYPLKMSDVFGILVDYFDVDPDIDIEKQGRDMTDEEVEYVETQLKGLGYL